MLFASTAAAALYDLKARRIVPTIQEVAPSIQFGSTKLVGLLFAAGWCDDCWETVPVMEKVASFTDICIYYISSDRTAEEMQSYCNSDVFSPIPFTNKKERAALKRHFQACAKKEMEEVGVTERRHGTPTLIVLDGGTGRVVTEAGVDDCMQNKTHLGAVIEGWKKLI